MSEQLLVRLVVAGFVVSVLVRCWYASRQAQPVLTAPVVRSRRTAPEDRRAVSRLIVSHRLRAAVNRAHRRPTYRPAGAQGEPATRRLAVTLTRAQTLVSRGSRRTAAPRRLRPVA